MKTKVLTSEGLAVYDEEIKGYIQSQGLGLSAEDVQNMINESDDIKLSEDSAYEPLD